MKISTNFISVIIFLLHHVLAVDKSKVTVFTVATEKNHGFLRFLRSAKIYGIDVQVLGMNEKWSGGNMNNPGGGQKINLLKTALNSMDIKDENHIVLFTDSYDVIFLNKMEEIIKKFKSLPNTRVLFAAEIFCWPDDTLAIKYPNVNVHSPYLNSGGFIGYLSEIKKIVNHENVANQDDDQLYYTKIYLDAKLRESLKISLDHNSAIFQNLAGEYSSVELRANTTNTAPYLENVSTKEKPLIIHGNGPSKLTINHFGNYLANAWSGNKCIMCEENRKILEEDKLPVIMMAVFIEQNTPFLEEFLQQIVDTDYPKSKINLLLRNNVEYHENEVDNFFQAHSKEYLTAKRIKPGDFISEAEARNIAKDRCVNSVCDYFFSVDSLSRINSNTLRYLIASGYDVVAPMLVRPNQAWSNFWGAINAAGFYARATDYMDIVHQAIRGIWNVPFITNCYLVKIEIFKYPSVENSITYSIEELDPDMAFCKSLRDKGIFMYVSNELDFGHLVNPETYDITLTNPDVYQIFDNKIDWEKRYVSEEYAKNFKPNKKPLMPCPDVYWFPLMTKRFCLEWIEVMEAFGKWSDGTSNDKRLKGGYEAVPTRDIHMNQVGLELHWLYILKEYVRPLQELVFTGYYHNPPISLMNFVVRYRPEEQPSLRPHHDSSTYTINLALNTLHVDYEGGGCRFLRYNCSVQDTKQGWLLMHPGRLTHYHEGLTVTNGTRYIMISFIDP